MFLFPNCVYTIVADSILLNQYFQKDFSGQTSGLEVTCRSGGGAKSFMDEVKVGKKSAGGREEDACGRPG